MRNTLKFLLGTMCFSMVLSNYGYSSSFQEAELNTPNDKLENKEQINSNEQLESFKKTFDFMGISSSIQYFWGDYFNKGIGLHEILNKKYSEQEMQEIIDSVLNECKLLHDKYDQNHDVTKRIYEIFQEAWEYLIYYTYRNKMNIQYNRLCMLSQEDLPDLGIKINIDSIIKQYNKDFRNNTNNFNSNFNNNINNFNSNFNSNMNMYNNMPNMNMNPFYNNMRNNYNMPNMNPFYNNMRNNYNMFNRNMNNFNYNFNNNMNNNFNNNYNVNNNMNNLNNMQFNNTMTNFNNRMFHNMNQNNNINRTNNHFSMNNQTNFSTLNHQFNTMNNFNNRMNINSNINSNMYNNISNVNMHNRPNSNIVSNSNAYSEININTDISKLKELAYKNRDKLDSTKTITEAEAYKKYEILNTIVRCLPSYLNTDKEYGDAEDYKIFFNEKHIDKLLQASILFFNEYDINAEANLAVRKLFEEAWDRILYVLPERNVDKNLQSKVVDLVNKFLKEELK